MPYRTTYKVLFFNIMLGVAFLCNSDVRIKSINSDWGSAEDENIISGILIYKIN